MTRTYTFNSASLGGPWAIGFDSLWDRLHTIESGNSSSNYPPYNIIKHGTEHWSIELAVAGFKRGELDIELAEGVLTVSANTESNAEVEYVHRGLAKRAFTRKWTLADDVIIHDASLVDGVLSIKLERIIPDEKKPRKIEIL
jgi:molecular chaperone IbpA